MKSVTAFSVHSSATYKEALRGVLEDKKDSALSRHSYSFQAMAKACGVQKTYLSKVFNGDAHLNSDQLFAAARYLDLSGAELERVTLLHERERAQNPDRRAHLAQRLEELETRSLASQTHLKAKPARLQKEIESEFFLDPELQIVQLYLCIPKYAANPASLAKRMGISTTALDAKLAKLERLGFVERKGAAIRVLRNDLHLGDDSPLIGAYRSLMRLKAVERFARTDASPKNAPYGFSALFSASEKTKIEIHRNFLAFLKESERLARASAPEEVYLMNFDLFGWSLATD